MVAIKIYYVADAKKNCLDCEFLPDHFLAQILHFQLQVTTHNHQLFVQSQHFLHTTRNKYMGGSLHRIRSGFVSHQCDHFSSFSLSISVENDQPCPKVSAAASCRGRCEWGTLYSDVPQLRAASEHNTLLLTASSEPAHNTSVINHHEIMLTYTTSRTYFN